MEKSHAVGRAWVYPTPAQLKELFAQIESGKMTKTRMQGVLRGLEEVEPASAPSIFEWMATRGFALSNESGQARTYPDFKEWHQTKTDLGFLDCTNAGTNTFKIFGRFRRPFVATLRRQKPVWKFEVYGLEYALRFQELARELEEIYSVPVTVELTDGKPRKESFHMEGGM
jgi:hypothetical protein